MKSKSDKQLLVKKNCTTCDHCAVTRFENKKIINKSVKTPKKDFSTLFTLPNRIIVSSVLFAVGLILTHTSLTLYAISILSLAFVIIGADIVLDAFKNLFAGHLLDEKFLMTIASLGAFGVKQIPEGVAVMLFYQIGEAFNDYAINKSKHSIKKLMELKPDIAHKVSGSNIEDISPENINIGDYIIIRAGERIPLDAIVIEGESSLDVSALTGESLPITVSPNFQIVSGAVNQSGILKAKVTKRFAESTFSRIIDMVENSNNKKAKSEIFIKRFAHYYTPIVVVAAVFTTLIPVLFFQGSFSTWFYRSLMFLVVSCPCALVLSVPLAFFGGIGAASRKGILIKGGSFIEQLAKTDTFVFDKTGTLTKGKFQVTSIKTYDFDEDKVLEIAAKVESLTSHPIGRSIVAEYSKRTNKDFLKNPTNTTIKEEFGKGISATIEDKEVLVGNNNFLIEKGIKIHNNSLNTIDTTNSSILLESMLVQVAINDIHVATIYIGDTLKNESKKSIIALKKAGIKRIIMLTGDQCAIANSIAKKIGIQEVYAELLPSDKVTKLELLMVKSHKTVFVGDGINDAPSLARADVGIAMGALGSDAAIEASDVVIMGEELSELPTLIHLSKKTLRIAKENIIFALSVKVLIMILAVFGIGTMWIAVFGDVGVSILAVINALRLLLTTDKSSN
jgi:Cd2+/Zn2+-exporting ATPase